MTSRPLGFGLREALRSAGVRTRPSINAQLDPDRIVARALSGFNAGFAPIPDSVDAYRRVGEQAQPGGRQVDVGSTDLGHFSRPNTFSFFDDTSPTEVSAQPLESEPVERTQPIEGGTPAWYQGPREEGMMYAAGGLAAEGEVPIDGDPGVGAVAERDLSFWERNFPGLYRTQRRLRDPELPPDMFSATFADALDEVRDIGLRQGANVIGDGISRALEQVVSAPRDAVDMYRADRERVEDRLASLTERAAAAAAYGAENATALYNLQIEQAQDELARLQAQEGQVGAQWQAWRDAMDRSLTDLVAEAQTSYEEYRNLTAQGYDEYTAALISRFGEYQQGVQQAIGGYMQQTNEQFGNVLRRLPQQFAPVAAAIAEGNTQALEAINQIEAERRSDIANVVTEQTEQFNATMERIGASNPALADEVLQDLRLAASQATRDLTRESGQARDAQQAVSRVAETAARFELADRMANLETERFQAIRDAEREREMLLNESARDLGAGLERTAFERERALKEIDKRLDNMLSDIDFQRREALAESITAEDQMRAELESSIGRLTDQLATTALRRDLTEEEVRHDVLSDAGFEFDPTTGTWTPPETNVTEFAAEVAAEAGLDAGLTEEQTQRELELIVELVEGMGILSVDQLNSALANNPQLSIDLQAAEYADFDTAFQRMFGEFVTARGSVPDEPLGAGSPPFIGSPLPGVAPQGIGTFDYHDGEARSGRRHKGIDLPARDGDPFRMIADGEYRYIPNNGDAGNTLIVDHGDGWYTRYLHLNPATGDALPDGERGFVTAGDQVALVGNTGNSQAPHLHFEVLFGEPGALDTKGGPHPARGFTPIDPTPLLTMQEPESTRGATFRDRERDR